MSSQHSSSSDELDEESESSSIVYDHEPFVTFSSRVKKFGACTIWPDSTEDEITVERLKGGGFNRIIGLSRDKQQYILRIPRFDAAKVGNEVAVLRFLSQHTGIPAPKVVVFDETESNVLGSPYAVHTRVPGVDLYSTFPQLSSEDKCKAARELGDVINQMLALRSNAAGRLVLAPDHEDSSASIHVSPFQSTDSGIKIPFNDSSPMDTVGTWLMALFHGRKADCLKQDPSDTVEPHLLDQFCQMASELDVDGWLVDKCYSLCHLDLAPRNILVNPTTNGEGPIISGILDWDSAILAPMILSCAPPMWIWAWNENEDEDERFANDDPPTLEGLQLKRLFEEAAGENYKRLAYNPAYRLARRLIRFAMEGVRSNEDFKEAKTMLGEWADARGL